MRKWFAAIVLVLGAVAVPLNAPDAASAPQAPDAQGWWWRYRVPELPVDPKPLVPVFPDLPEVPPPPTVPADGLYVSSTPAGNDAVAALTWVLPEGSTADTLTLTPTTPLPPTTAIRACLANSTWQPVQAGRWSSRPQYACQADSPLGVVPTDGSVISFKLGALGQSRLVDLVLVPDAQSVVQATFSKPDKTALNIVPGAAAETSSASGTGADVLGSTQQPNSLNNSLGGSSFASGLTPYLQPGQDATIGAAPVIDFQQPQALAPVATATREKDTLETFGIFGLIALAALFSRFRAQPTREPKSLVNFGKSREADVS